MKVEDIKISQTQSSLSEEAILLLRKLIMMLAPISTNTSMVVRVDTTGSSNMDGVGVITNYGAATLPNITSINQLGGAGLTTSQGGITIIDSTPIDGSSNYAIDDLITLSGNGIVKVTDVYDRNITSINTIPVSGGTGYSGGEIISLDGGFNGRIMVQNIDNNGTVLEVSLIDAGYYYNIGSTSTSTSSSGLGLIIDILSVGSNIGMAKSIVLVSGGTNYLIGNYPQLSTNGNGTGLIVSVLNVDAGYGNNNFLQMDTNRWLYTDMIRNGIQF